MSATPWVIVAEASGLFRRIERSSKVAPLPAKAPRKRQGSATFLPRLSAGRRGPILWCCPADPCASVPPFARWQPESRNLSSLTSVLARQSHGANTCASSKTATHLILGHRSWKPLWRGVAHVLCRIIILATCLQDLECLIRHTPSLRSSIEHSRSVLVTT